MILLSMLNGTIAAVSLYAQSPSCALPFPSPNLQAALLFRRRRLRAPTPGAAAAKGDIAAAAATAAKASGARIASGVMARKTHSSAGGGAGGVEGGLTPLESVVASTIAGVINVLATTPLWVSNLRIKAGHGVGGLFTTLGSIGR